MCLFKVNLIFGLAMFYFIGLECFAVGKYVVDKSLIKVGYESKLSYIQLETVYQTVEIKNGHPVTRNRRSYKSRSRKQSDDWSVPVLMPVAILLQILVPFIHMIIAVCKKKSACRILSMHAFFSFICWLIYLIGCMASQCAAYGTAFGLLNGMAFIMIFVCYLVMLIESFYSNEKQYISSIVSDISAIEFVNKLRNTDPERVMLIECYHWETRTRTVTSTDAQGNTQTHIETYQEIVITHTESQKFPIQFTRDISDQHGLKFDQYSVTRLKLTPDVQFGDTETEEKFEEMRTKMIEENEHRDTNIQFSFSDSIDGFVNRICAYTDPNNQPFWMNVVYYWVASVLGLTWIYRAIFIRKTAKCEYTIKKMIYFQTPSDSTERTGGRNVQIREGLDNTACPRTETDTRLGQQAQPHKIYPPYPAPTEYMPTVVDNCPPTHNPANASFAHASSQQQTNQPYPLAASKPAPATIHAPGRVHNLALVNVQPHVMPGQPPAAYPPSPVEKAKSIQPMRPPVTNSPHQYGHLAPAVIYRPEGIRYLPHANIAAATTSNQPTQPPQHLFAIPAGSDPVMFDMHPFGPRPY
eukprot:Seg385.18 transcript_id=Seg385.18/GoldUCD/mRNA.D3Y31 product="Transmembrane protein 151B" protein_id=Seg385.18/GoldUCD/D3Y31